MKTITRYAWIGIALGVVVAVAVFVQFSSADAVAFSFGGGWIMGVQVVNAQPNTEMPINSQGQTGGSGIIPCTGPKCSPCQLIEAGTNIYNLLVGLGALAALVALIFGAVKMMIGVSADIVEEGKTAVKQAITGLIILLVSFVLVNTILAILGTSIDERTGVCGGGGNTSMSMHSTRQL